MRRALILLYAFSGGCRAAPAAQAADEQQVAPAQHSNSMAGMEAEHAMAGMVSNEDLHLRLTPRRAATAADSARAAEGGRALAGRRRQSVQAVPDPTARFTLVGGTSPAPLPAGDAERDPALPLSIARWH